MLMRTDNSTTRPVSARMAREERSHFSFNEGSSSVRKRKRDTRDEHAGKGSSRLSTGKARSPLMKRQRPSYILTPLAVSSSISSPLVVPALRALSSSLHLTAENPFQRWLDGLDTQKAKCDIHGSALVTLYGRHQSCLADLDGKVIG